MAGANTQKPIKIIGGDGNIYVVETWNRGTIADGNVMTNYTIRPICSAIQGGTSGLSAETERAMSAESAISAIVDKHYDEYNTFVSSVNISAELFSARDDYLQEQINTLEAATDVIMVYSGYSAFSSNSGSLTLTDNDVIKVLYDEKRQENQTYYQYSTATSAWSFIGELDPYYSKSDLNNAAGKNINITTANGLKINTNDNVNFDSVSASTAYGSSAKFTNISATEAKVLTLTANTLYGQSNNSNVDSLIGSAQSGAEASAWVNNTLFDYSYTTIDTETASGSIDKITILYKNDAHSQDNMLNQEVVFSRGNYSVSGILIQAANNTDNGKVLTYNTAYNNYTWQAIPNSTYSNDDGYISIDNQIRTINLSTTGIKTSAYSAELIDGADHYNSKLNGETLYFGHGQRTINIALTGVSYYAGGTRQGSANWDNLFQNYAQVNREKISTTNLTADKVNFVVASGSSGTQPYKAVNFVVTSTLPSIIENNTYYII